MALILVIEDQPQMRRKLVRVLEMENHTALSAGNGREGLEMAREQIPDLIICDVMMPEMNGHEVLGALRSEPATAGIAFIFLTARGTMPDLRKGMNLGADDYLAKPASMDDLLRSISVRLKRREQATERAPAFTTPEPLQKLGLSPREAEVLFWVAQGKTNGETGTILTLSEGTVRKHLEHIFAKLGVENRTAAGLRAIECLSGQ